MLAGPHRWLAASSFFYQYFRVYSPITFGKKYDPEGKFVKHFLPVLKVRCAAMRWPAAYRMQGPRCDEAVSGVLLAW